MIIAGNCPHTFYELARHERIGDKHYVCGFCGTLATAGEKLLHEAPTAVKN